MAGKGDRQTARDQQGGKDNQRRQNYIITETKTVGETANKTN